MSTSSSIQFALQQPRLVAYQQLMTTLDQLGTPMAGASVWIDFLNRLPLTLGETAAERSVMYSLSDGTYDIIHRSVDSLLDLIRRRNDPDYEQEKKSALLTDERSRVALWPKRYCPRTIPENNPLRSVIRLSLQESPDLDAGLMESWLSSSAGGKRFFDMLSTLSAKFFAAGSSQASFSGVTLMSHLALLDSILDAKTGLKQTSFKNTSYASLDRAVGMAFHACFHSAVSETLTNLPSPPSTTPEYRDKLVLMTCIAPLLFLSIRKEDLNHDVNPYGLTENIQDTLWPIYQSVLEQSNQPLHILKECLRIVSGQQVLVDTLLPMALGEAFRRLILDHLMTTEDPASSVDQLLGRAFYKNEDLLGLLEDSRTMNELSQDLNKRVKRSAAKDETIRLCAFINHVRSSGLRRSKKKLTENDLLMLQDLLERFTLRRMDEYATANIQQSLKRVTDRRKETSTSALIQEYQAGRLYRISDDDHPLVKGRIVFEEAQLFVDLKGYTRRTACAKELVMAEFLKSEFYQPIIEAAKKYYVGLAWNPSDSIQLVNLLGDAVAFSGNIVSMVDLAYDIQMLFRYYREKLQALSPMEEESAFLSLLRRVEQQRAAILSEIEQLQKDVRLLEKEIHQRQSVPLAEMVNLLQADYQKQLEDLQKKYLEIQKHIQQNKNPDLYASLEEVQKAYDNLKNHRKQTFGQLQAAHRQDHANMLSTLICQVPTNQLRDLGNRISSLEKEDQALCDSLEEERNLHQGFGLDAGLYISFGSAAEVIQINDDLWGVQRVSICERLNESARGTARNNLVKRNLDELLAAARIEKGAPKLELPFRVYITQTRPFDLDSTLNRLWNRAFSEKSSQLLDRFINTLQEKLSRKLEQIDDTDGRMQIFGLNDIYNLGEAISESGLNAYLEATRSTHFFFYIQVKSTDLHPEIQKRFLFIDDTLHLVVGTKLATNFDKIELFHYVGQTLFRGFEGTESTRVLEIIRSNSMFAKLLQKHHLSKWLAEAHQDQKRKIQDLQFLNIGIQTDS